MGCSNAALFLSAGILDSDTCSDTSVIKPHLPARSFGFPCGLGIRGEWTMHLRRILGIGDRRVRVQDVSYNVGAAIQARA